MSIVNRVLDVLFTTMQPGSSDDIVPELFSSIQGDFHNLLRSSGTLKRLEGLLGQGKATFDHANAFAVEIGSILSSVLRAKITPGALPNGRMYYNIAHRILTPTFELDYVLASNFTAAIQELLNGQAGIGIRAAQPIVNQGRIEGFINRLSSEEDVSEVLWILGEPVINFSQSAVDDVMSANIDRLGAAGVYPTVTRVVSGNCCKWCQEVAGEYRYPNVPGDVWRRHNRCRCTVTYNPADGKGRAQNVHTKRWTESPPEQIQKPTPTQVAILKHLNLPKEMV